MDFLVCRLCCFQTLQTGSGSIRSAGHCQPVPVHDPLMESLPDNAGSSAGQLGACRHMWAWLAVAQLFCPFFSGQGLASQASPWASPVSQHSGALSCCFSPGAGGADLLRRAGGLLIRTICMAECLEEVLGRQISRFALPRYPPWFS